MKVAQVPTDEMIEAGAKAAYGAIFLDPEDWPDVRCSVRADGFRKCARACYVAMVERDKG